MRCVSFGLLRVHFVYLYSQSIYLSFALLIRTKSFWRPALQEMLTCVHQFETQDYFSCYLTKILAAKMHGQILYKYILVWHQ